MLKESKRLVNNYGRVGALKHVDIAIRTLPIGSNESSKKFRELIKMRNEILSMRKK